MLKLIRQSSESECNGRLGIGLLPEVVSLSKERFTIGRSIKSNIVLSDLAFSREHCVIQYDNETNNWLLVDTSSTGTWINDVQLPKGSAKALKEKDQIKLSSPTRPCTNAVVYEFNCLPLEQLKPSTSKLQEKKLLNQVLPVESKEGFKENARLDRYVPESQLKCLAAEEAEKRKKLEESFADELLAQKCKIEQLKEQLKVMDEKAVHRDVLHQGKEEEWSYEKENLVSEVQKQENRIREMTDDFKKQFGIEKESWDTARKNVEEEKLLLEQRIKQLETEAAQRDIASENHVKLIEGLMESELQCAICTEIVVNAQILVCGHTFCQVCFDLWREKNSQCPNCRKKVKRTYSGRMIDGFVNKMVDTLSDDFKAKREQLVQEKLELNLNKRTRIDLPLGEPQAYIDLTTTFTI